jgi:hypothetical protein
LSEFEDRLGRAIEGVFAGAFRSPVQPVEIAKDLARRMDDGRVVGVGRVYAPTSFRVLLSPDDTAKLADFRDVLAGELATYLVAHAREHGYHLAEKPHVAFETDEGLKLGRFRAVADLAPKPAVPAPDAERVATREPAHEPDRTVAAPVMATVTVGDTHHDVTLTADRTVVGRLAECDICIDDVNASRQHAAFVRDAGRWFVEDLGSTNGTKLNGRKVARELLSDGDIVTVGVTRLVFHESAS